MDIYRLGLTGALSAIADGRITARDYLESCIARTEALEPRVHAFAHFDAAAVRAAFDALPSGGALRGMPIGVKDVIATKGVPTEMGSPAYRGHVPERSASVIDALSDVGALVFGKTVTTEFAWRQPGATRNPWNLAHSPGGSSSGSAAAVAYGAVPGALGTQTLGSVLRPAAYCGVVGFKPSYSAIPRTGVYAVSTSLDHVGVFARNVVDAALLASALTTHDGIDVAGHAPLVPAWPLRERESPPRIALLRTSAWTRAAAAQQDLVEAVASRLAARGAIVSSVEFPARFDALWDTARTLCDFEAAQVNGELADEIPPRISRHTLELVARGRTVSATDHAEAKAVQRAMIDAFASIVAPFDALLMAPALGEAPAGLDDTGDAVFCTPASLLGAPALSLPAGRGVNGLPLGVQFVGAWNDDRRLLETAAWAEREIGWSQGFPTIGA